MAPRVKLPSITALAAKNVMMIFLPSLIKKAPLCCHWLNLIVYDFKKTKKKKKKKKPKKKKTQKKWAGCTCPIL